MIVALLLLALPAWAAPTVRAASEVVSADPGSVVTLGFRIDHPDFGSVDVAPGVFVGRPLALVISESPFTIAGPRAVGRPVAVRVPVDAPAGDYAVAYVIGSAADQIAESTIRVEPVTRARLQRLTGDVEILDGESARFRYTIANEGNTPLDLEVRTNLTDGSWVARPPRLTVGIAETAEVVVDAHPASRGAGPTRVPVVVSVHRPRATRALSTDRGNVTVWPSPRARPDPYDRLATSVTAWGVTRQAGDTHVVTGQVDAEAAGYLDADDRTRLQLRARLPGDPGLLYDRSRTEAWLDLRHAGDDPWQVRLGDGSYVVSPLLGGGYLRGGEIDVEKGPWLVGVMGGANRFSVDRTTLGALTVGARPGADDRLLVHAALIDDDGPVPVLTHEGDLRFRFGDGRMGLIRYEVGGGPDGLGISQELFAALPFGSLRLDGSWTAPGFPGPQGNRDRYGGEFRQVLAKSTMFTSRVSWVRYQRADLGQGRGLRSVEGQVQVDQRASATSRWSGRYRLRNQASLDDPHATSWLDHGLEGAYRWRRGPFHVDVEARGHTRSGPRVAGHYTLGGGLGAGVTVMRWFQAGIQGRADANPGFLSPAQPTVSAGARLRLDDSDRTQLAVDWLVAGNPGLTPLSQQVRVDGAWRLPWTHLLRLDLDLRVPGGSLPGDLQGALGYEVPLGIPLRRRPDYGAIRGWVRDEATGEGIEGAVVRTADRAARTDAQGRFVLADLVPGDHSVSLSPTLAGLGKVPVGAGPASVAVPEKRRGVSVAETEIVVTDGAAVTLDVTLYRDEAGAVGAASGKPPSWVPVRVLPRTTVELTQGERVRRDMTDSLGRLTVRGLVPGEWTVRVAAPPDTRIDPATATVVVVGGQTVEHQIRVIPVRKEIVIQGDAAPVPMSVPPPKPRVLPATLELQPGESDSVEVVLAKADASAKLTWSSKDPAIAQVDGAGRVTAIAEGRTEIVVARGGKAFGSVPVVVRIRPLVGLTVSTTPIALRPGETHPMRVRGIDTDGRVFDASTRVAWVSEDPSVATVDAAGRVTAVAPGITRVYAEAQGVRSFQVDVRVAE